MWLVVGQTDEHLADIRARQQAEECVDGVVQVLGRVSDDPVGGRFEAHDLVATFSTVSSVPWEVIEGEWVDPLVGVEDCGLYWTGQQGLVDDGGPVWNDPGGVAVTGPWSPMPLDLDRQEGGRALNHWIDAAALGYAAGYGESYDFDTVGAAASGDWGGTGRAFVAGNYLLCSLGSPQTSC